MPNLDHSLIHRVQQCMKGDDVHCVRTWLFLYEKSSPGSADRIYYECLLRKYVAKENVIRAAHWAAEVTRQASKELCTRSRFLNQAVDSLLRAR
jgi:hypothetical protein